MSLGAVDICSLLCFFSSKGEEIIQKARQPEKGKNKEREGEKRTKGERAKREESQAVRGKVQSEVSAQ